MLRPTTIGKDYPYHGEWCYLGLTIGWVEGIELNFFGGVFGLDIRRPALKLPGLGRLGLPLMQ